jgi:cobalamin biosynthetic protein CobC
VAAGPVAQGGGRLHRAATREHPHAWQRPGTRCASCRTPRCRALAAATPYVLLLCNRTTRPPTVIRTTRVDAARQLHKRGGWLIVDEAFVDATPELSVTPLAGTPEAPNLIVLRSLGKFFGLAGVRVGFVFAAPELLRRMQEAMGPWAVSGPSREAARLALADTAWQAAARPQLQAAGERLRQLLVPLGEVKATALFATLSSPHSNELFDYLARRAS